MRKRLPVMLFFIGLMLESAGFLLGAAEHIPLIYRMFSPGYVSAMEGLETLETQQLIDDSVTGFVELSNIFVNEASSQNTSEIMNRIRVTNFRLTGNSGLAFGKTGVRETVPVSITLSNGQKVEWNLVKIRQKVQQLKNRSIFAWGVALFVLGLFVQVLGFVVGKHERSPV